MGSSLNSGLWSRLQIFVKFSSVAVMLLLMIAALGPAKWQPPGNVLLCHSVDGR